MLSFHLSSLKLWTTQTHRAGTILLSTEGHACHVWEAQKRSWLATHGGTTYGVTFRVPKTPQTKLSRSPWGKVPLCSLCIYSTQNYVFKKIPFGGMEGNRQAYWAVFTPVHRWHHASVQRQACTFNFSHAHQRQTVPAFVLMTPSGASHNCGAFSFQTRCNGSNTWNPLTFTVRKFIISHRFGINVFAWLLGL